MTIALIIATYNNPRYLEQTLRSVAQQTRMPDEVIVADDGSTDATRLLVERLRTELGLPLIHVWHPDQGFRLAAIRNKAIARATSEYIVQIDGDIVLHPHFIADHEHFARRGAFVTGSRYLLTPQATERLLAGDAAALPHGVYIPQLSPLMRRLRGADGAYVRGCHMAFWRDDLLRVNGYNEDITGWGREDSELSLRLIHSGLKKDFIKFGAIEYHLWHPEQSRQSDSANTAIMNRARNQGITWIDNGIAKSPAESHASKAEITVVMALYNCVDYLEEAVRSVRAQTFKPWQLIIVDDGSTDGSSQLADSLAAADWRISVIHKPNTGVSDTRNVALRRVETEWVTFLDADDRLTPDALQTMLDAAHEFDADVVQCGFNSFWTNRVKPSARVAVDPIVYEGDNIIPAAYDDKVLTNYISAKLYRRSVLHPPLPVSRFFEDYATVMLWLANARRVVVLPQRLYDYRMRMSGTVLGAYPDRQLDYLRAEIDRAEFAGSRNAATPSQQAAKILRAAMVAARNISRMPRVSASQAVGYINLIIEMLKQALPDMSLRPSLFKARSEGVASLLDAKTRRRIRLMLESPLRFRNTVCYSAPFESFHRGKPWR